ncbi:MAG TPA: peptidoglycan-binding domain-containing protein [Polyangia bacterium]|nr:peptidoglycan-binding domain-containing protein [Polyangia bacterium]
MKLVLIVAVAGLLSSPFAASAARHKHAHHKTRAHRARTRARPTVAPARAHDATYLAKDELELSPTLMRKLQSNLIDGGYLRGTIDGRLTARTRRALVGFQREYHLAPTGRLDRATADALLGTEVIGAYMATRD